MIYGTLQRLWNLCLPGLIGVKRKSGRQRFCDPSGVVFNDGLADPGVSLRSTPGYWLAPLPGCESVV